MPNMSLKLNFSPNGLSGFQDTKQSTAAPYEHIYKDKNMKLKEFSLDADFSFKV